MAQNSKSGQIATGNENDNRWVALARTHWLNASKVRRAKPDFIKSDIWDPLSDEGFHFRSLLMLENLSLLERSSNSPCSGKWLIKMLTSAQIFMADLL